MSGFLTIADGRRVAIEDGMTIGRAADCHLVLEDAKVSRHHARLVAAGGVVEIEDLGSSNGTLLNGKRVGRRMLRPGDTLQIGTTVLTFEEGVPPAPPEPPQPLGGAGGGTAAAAEDLFGDEPEPPAVEPRPTPAAPHGRDAGGRDPDVLEFEDEVVQVRRAPPRPSSEGPAERRQRTLQHSRQPSGGGLLRDDLAQMPGWQRNLLVLLAVAAAVGLGYLAMVLARG